jgi:hypothetical protein
MDRKQFRKGFAFAAGWAAVLIGFFAFGEQKARPALPACSSCSCKNITFWHIPMGTDLGAWDTGATNRLTQQTTRAIVSLNTTGGCNTYPPTTNGTYDQYVTTNCSPICTVSGVSAFPIEDACTDPGWVSGPNNYARPVCPP